MNRRLLIGILVALIGLVLITAGIFAITNLIRQGFAPAAAPTPIPIVTTQLLATTHDIAAGSVISNEDVQFIEVPVSVAARNAITDITRAVGRITAVHLIQGELLMEHHLADPTNIAHDIGYIIGDDQVLMAFHPNDLMSSLNVLQRGDLVDIFVSITVAAPVTPSEEEAVTTTITEEDTLERLFTFDANQRIQISAIIADIVMDENVEVQEGQPQPTPKPSQVTVRAYLLALSPQDALVLKHLRDTGAIFDLVLRSPTSTELFELTPVTLEYLLERYQLEIIER
ncbi:MAG TPA: SAF domain-containing protein [Anaerolineales bacterium]|nr:SAF domain-containing protein [Anaerolineales bacterium]